MSERYTITIVIDTDEDPSEVLDAVHQEIEGGFLQSFIEGEIDPDEVAVSQITEVAR